MLDQPLQHDEVIETTERVKANFLALVKTIVKQMNMGPHNENGGPKCKKK